MTDLPNPPAGGQDDKQITGTPLGKERGDIQGTQEVTPVTEFTRSVDLEPEVEGWLEKIEKEQAQLQQPIKDDKGQVILSDTGQQKTPFKVVLPLTKDEVEKGLHNKIINSVRWLAEWCIRMIKMFGNKVAYKRAG